MLNIVNKYTSEVDESTDDEGVVAIEYVLVAGVVAVGITTVAFTGLWTDIKNKLDSII